ncbi:hypothetical protein XCR_4117 [Xanthomonas campestris pv. raphani 756C]|nr:hypothetical protein XCR_4117 [Xanthomonas campestris pv. raphani 756C]
MAGLVASWWPVSHMASMTICCGSDSTHRLTTGATTSTKAAMAAQLRIAWARNLRRAMGVGEDWPVSAWLQRQSGR